MRPKFRTQLLSALALGLSVAPAGAQSGAPDLATRNVWIDFDRDGLDDLYVLAFGSDDVLLRNLGDGSFADVTSQVGLAGRRSRLVCPADFDQDGSEDLLLVAHDGSLALCRGLVGGSFEAMSAEFGLDDTPAVAHVEWVDYDRDGWMDLKLETRTHEPMVFHNRIGRDFEPIDLGLMASGAHGAGLVSAESDRGSSLESPAAERGPDERLAGDLSGGGRSQASASSGVSVAGISAGPTGVASGTGTPFCAPALQDFTSTNCLTASSSPLLGMLYPLSQDWFVESGSGNVGLGTTTPAARLDVAGAARVDGGLTVSGSPLDIHDRSLRLFETTSGNVTVKADPTGNANGGEIRLRTDSNDSNVELYADGGSDDGMLILREASSLSGVVLRANDVFGSGKGALMNLFNDAGQASARMVADDGSGSGQLQLRNGSTGNNFVAVDLEAESSSGGQLRLYNTAGNRTIQLTAQTATFPASLILREDDNSRTVLLGGDTITGYDSAGSTTFEFDRQTGDATQPVSGDGFIKAAVVVDFAGNEVRSFNHISSTLTVQRIAKGLYNIKFVGADLTNRFFTVQQNVSGNRNSNVFAVTDTVTVSFTHPTATFSPFPPPGIVIMNSGAMDSAFTLFVY